MVKFRDELKLEPLFDGRYTQDVPTGETGHTPGRNVGARLIGSDPALRDEWVIVDPRVMAQLAKAQQITAADAVAGSLSGELRIDGESVPIEVGGELASLTSRLRSATAPHDLPLPLHLQRRASA